MAIIKAYTMPHPPLAVSDVGKGREADIAKTIKAMDEVSAEIKELAPDTIIFITPHSTMYSDYFHISPGADATGDLSRFGADSARFQVGYDEPLTAEIVRFSEEQSISAGFLGQQDALLDHGVTVPMWFINKHYSDYKIVRISQSGLSVSEHYRFGMAIQKAAETLGRKAVVIASSDLSHKLSHDGNYGFSPDGAKFDDLVTGYISKGDFLSLMLIPDDIRRNAAECGYGSLVILAGMFEKFDVSANLLSYEAPFGVGYAVAAFEFGNKGDSGSDSSSDSEGDSGSKCKSGSEGVFERYTRYKNSQRDAALKLEDEYQKLARRSLEHKIKAGEIISDINGLPSEMTEARAGVFVSIHKEGQLRGCIGTILPTRKSVAEEIVQNAISAGLSDNRFEPVCEDELEYLTYKVDVLSPPEQIGSIDELDVKKYGVIVKSGYKRGLLLPNLDGVDTVEQQIDIACQKAGIRIESGFELERFEVVRHG